MLVPVLVLVRSWEHCRVRGAPSAAAAAAAAAAVRRPPAAARRPPSATAAAAAVASTDYITQTPDRPPHMAAL